MLSEHVHDQLCFLGSEVKRFKVRWPCLPLFLRVPVYCDTIWHRLDILWRAEMDKCTLREGNLS